MYSGSAVDDAVETVVNCVVAVALQAVIVVQDDVVMVLMDEEVVPLALLNNVDSEIVSIQEGTAVLAVQEEDDEEVVVDECEVWLFVLWLSSSLSLILSLMSFSASVRVATSAVSTGVLVTALTRLPVIFSAQAIAVAASDSASRTPEMMLRFAIPRVPMLRFAAEVEPHSEGGSGASGRSPSSCLTLSSTF